ncbi:unnamed protein product [Cladocopium goreaui]|uniref:Phosphatidylglycerophosphatase and protein-tyrosine phosphatase 1 n=1 Tax=Cladocopium goreaui TaxID=2562237 RepID=A0A9P1G479_9DINO|nr:unnamed protein product [Cladocopium goreaui]
MICNNGVGELHSQGSSSKAWSQPQFTDEEIFRFQRSQGVKHELFGGEHPAEANPAEVVAILRTRPVGDDSFTDFVAATLSGAQCKDGHCRSAFRIFDRNADGYIDAKELELILRKGESSACLTEPAQATVAMLKEAGAGMVSFKDFVNFVKRGASLEL